MSHAANIRNRSRSGQTQEPQKRKRIDASENKVNGVRPITNGILDHASIAARPTRDAKPTISAQAVESAANVRHPDADEDVEMANGDSMMNGVGSEVSDEDEEESDDDEGDSEEDEEEGSGEEEEEEQDTTEQVDIPTINGTSKKLPEDTDSADEDEEQAAAGGVADDEDAAPSFGDMLKARGPEPIDVDALRSDSNANTKTVLADTGKRVLTLPNATSLGTVLTQALKTNDVELLESCFQVSELESIRATVERLPSAHATALLQRLSERMHKRPGRAGSLMVWVQWTVVAHGGYLASQPAAMRELQTLHQVVKQRANGLAPLLALKGKLDLLEAQLQLRRNIAARARARDPDAVQGTIYVEGQEESSSEDDLPPVMGTASIKSTKPRSRRSKDRNKNRRRLTSGVTAEASDEDIEGDMPTTMPNGIDTDGLEDDEEDSEDSDDEEDDLIDDEAEETDADSGDFSDEVDYEEVEELDEIPDSEDEDERPSKRSRAT